MQGATILIVEDDEDIRDALVDVLESEAYDVLQAIDGRAALKLLHAGAHPHLLLTDLMMPVMSGWQLLDALRLDPQLGGIPVLVLSADEVRSLPGAREVLRKPIELDQLLRAIHRYVP